MDSYVQIVGTRYLACGISEFIWLTGLQSLQGERLAPCPGAHRDAIGGRSPERRIGTPHRAASMRSRHS